MIDVTLNGTFKEAVLEQIGGLETHGKPLEIMEDDEKVVVWMRPCGSGQFLQETRHVYRGPQKCVPCKACPQTWNIDNFPVYCVHAPQQEILSIKQIGWPVMVNCPPARGTRRPRLQVCKAELRLRGLQGPQRHSGVRV